MVSGFLSRSCMHVRNNSMECRIPGVRSNKIWKSCKVCYGTKLVEYHCSYPAKKGSKTKFLTGFTESVGLVFAPHCARVHPVQTFLVGFITAINL